MERKEYTIQEETKLKIEDNTFAIVNLDVTSQLTTTITVDANAHVSLILYVKGSGHLDLNITCQPDSHVSYLWVNQSDLSLEVNEQIYLDRNAYMKANYGELTQGHHKKVTVYNMIGEHSNIEVRTASVTFDSLDWDMSAEHLAKHSEALLQNYAIGLKNSHFLLKVIGHIARGNSGSETHQVSRVMNLHPSINATVYPELLIDENDVAASHACTVGQPDIEQVYYLQARGLSKDESLRLLTLGYLLPIVDDIENETIKEELSNLIVEKVSGECLA